MEKKTKHAKHRSRHSSMRRSVDINAIRVQAIQDTIRAIIEEVPLGRDAFSEVAEMRAIARRLGVPFYAIAFAEQAGVSEDSRLVTEADIDAWRTWQQRHQTPALR